jgi:hypothetical protein
VHSTTSGLLVSRAARVWTVIAMLRGYYTRSRILVFCFENRRTTITPSTTAWEYLIVALPRFETPTTVPASAAVAALNREGDSGWEAVGMTSLADGSVAVLLKRMRDE